MHAELTALKQRRKDLKAQVRSASKQQKLLQKKKKRLMEAGKRIQWHVFVSFCIRVESVVKCSSLFLGKHGAAPFCPDSQAAKNLSRDDLQMLLNATGADDVAGD